MTDRLRIVVSGLAGLYPVGGVAWDYLQYVLGFDSLGHDVSYVEDTWTWPFDPRTGTVTDSGDYSAGFLQSFFELHAPHLGGRWHYRHLGGATYGMDAAEVRGVLASADLYLNVSGGNPIPEQCGDTCLKVFLDTDPGYNQAVLQERFAWHPNAERWLDSVLAHDVFATYAENIHGTDCLVPRLGLAWIPTRPPVHMPSWNADHLTSEDAPWSTVMTWNEFAGRIHVGGVEYGSKDLEFPRIMHLPARFDRRFDLAIGGRGVPLEALREAGWAVTESYKATSTPAAYQAMIGRSRGEVSIAKNIYVAMRTGWFSGRSTCYLASGRPVIVQDTGFSAHIPTGLGLLAFSDTDDAVASIELVEADHERHARAARELCREWFGADRVLPRMLDDVFAAAERPAASGHAREIHPEPILTRP